MRRWMTVAILTCATALSLIYFLHNRGEDLEGMASLGQIQADAPIKASVETVIQAPPEKVWKVLTDVNHWPQWQSNISEARMDGPLQAGTFFTWSSGMQIKSRLALVDPDRRLAWTGSAMNAHAIHVWDLEPLRGGRTRVRVDESMSGALLTFFYSSKELAASNQLWLEGLKHEAER